MNFLRHLSLGVFLLVGLVRADSDTQQPDFDHTSWYQIWFTSFSGLAVYGDNKINGTDTSVSIQFNNNKIDGQHWQIYPISSSSFAIRNKYAGADFYLAAADSSPTVPALRKSDSIENDKSVIWTITPWGDGGHYLTNQANGTYYRLGRNTTYVNTDFGLYMDGDTTKTDAERFTFTKLDAIGDSNFDTVQIPGFPATGAASATSNTASSSGTAASQSNSASASSSEGGSSASTSASTLASTSNPASSLSTTSLASASLSTSGPSAPGSSTVGGSPALASSSAGRPLAPTASSKDSTEEASAGSGLSPAAAAGVAIAATVVLGVIGSALAILFFKRRQRKRKHVTSIWKGAELAETRSIPELHDQDVKMEMPGYYSTSELPTRER